MIIQLDRTISDANFEAMLSTLKKWGIKTSEVKTQSSHYLIALAGEKIDIRSIGTLPGVLDVHRVSDPYKLVSRKWKVKATVIDLGDGVTIGGGGKPAIMMGPCSIEDKTQIEDILAFLKTNKVGIFRGGAFKPRTSPYSFRGLGIPGLKMIREIASQSKIKIISEVLEPSQIEEMYPYIDIYQVGTRNSQNFNLLHELGKIDKPVLIKRGMSGTIEELLHSAEYVFSSGNEKILLCERGIRTFEKAYRNVLDINAIPMLKEKSHLPVIVDPSHGVGIRRFVPPIALAGLIAGADGLLVEIHKNPEMAASDGDQTLSFEEAEQLIERVNGLF
jgi:3-deoxy-7-phosphoheptulonate synthase